MTWTNPRTWLAGEDPPASTYNLHIRDNFKALGDAWTSYTPTWAASGTAVSLGNGTLTGAYMNTGQLCIGRIFLTMGTTTTFGTGNYSFTLPFTSAVGAQWFPLGGCTCRDQPSNTYGLVAFTASSTTVTGGTDAGGRLGPTTPFTFASTDTIGINFMYEVA